MFFRRDSSDTNSQTMVDARSGFTNLARNVDGHVTQIQLKN